MKLAIISHTEHYKLKDGSIVGWGPTINEINHLLEVFDTIYHVAMLHELEAPPSALGYSSDRVVFVSLPPLGGHGVGAKLKILWKAPSVISIIYNTLKKADKFQFRAPTGIGVYVIPFLSLCVKKPGWFKYAGNWNQETPPLGYRLQRWMLQQQSRKVTMNGSWPNQPTHCISFENPCLTINELEEGLRLGKEKSIASTINFCYVGRLEKPKGVERIIKALAGLSASEKSRVGVVHLVGDGKEKDYFLEISRDTGIRFKFHGFLPRHEVFEIYRESQVFLMPTTASEGFPKVIAEAMNYGCLPVVSNISSIGQYIIDGELGYCLKEVSAENLREVIRELMGLSDTQYKTILNKQRGVVEKFTYKYYNLRIKTEIL
ncbi:MAG: glycosyltransferase [Arenibacter latericius]|nr:glycosyltransferase [Arenibacter latericius]